ncbi:MAG: class II glutamine amidotransferase [Planctomycetota bacterium]
MCRLYGYRSERPTQVECGLIRSQNSLLEQSAQDQRGLANADGWGIAYYLGDQVRVRRRVPPASRDREFRVVAEGIRTHLLVAHVRRATIGDVSLANVHPFTVGRWAFAHNGTVPAFERIGPRLAAETSPGLLRRRRGTTDSEATFLWILSAIVAKHPGALEEGVPADVLARCLGDAVARIVHLCRETRVPERPVLNFLLTDGRGLAASRLGNSLHVLERQVLGTCELCSECHCERCREGRCGHEAPVACRAVAVASEPLTSEEWRSVPEGCVVAVNEGCRLELSPCPLAELPG